MRIQKSYISGGLRLIIGLLALDGFLAQLASLGADAWRVFDTWTILLTAGYFCVLAVLTFAGWLQTHRGRVICPMLYGMIIVGNLCALLLWAVFKANHLPWLNGVSGQTFVLDILVPLLTLVDWAIFAKKGSFRAYDPWYWLGLPLIYMATMLVTSIYLPSSHALRYPYPFLDYHTIGISNMFWWTLIISTVVLLLGYVLMLLDFALSGKLSEHVVLPKIKTIVIEEEVEEPEVVIPEPVDQETVRKVQQKRTKKAPPQKKVQ